MNEPATTVPREIRNPAADRIPSGWYQVGWSGDFEIGSVTPLQYFSQALVAFRTESGELRVLDAFCPHMGAHMGYGGLVVESDIQCPYHGWRWNGEDGLNTCIPYGDKDQMRLSVRAWPTRETDGIALVYYGPPADDVEPPRLPESFIGTDGEVWDPYPTSTSTWHGVEMVPQLAAENAPDAAHFEYIHGSPKSPELAGFATDNGCFEAMWELTFGEGRPPTWATPTGAFEGSILTQFWGLGLGWNVQRGFDEVTSLSAYTPVDERSVDVRLTVWAPRARHDGSPLDEELRDRWFRFQRGQIESDMNVWSRQTYVEKPPFASTESAAMRAMRDWSRQFYVGMPLPASPVRARE